MEQLQRLLRQGLDAGYYLGAAFSVVHVCDGVLGRGWVGRAQENPDVFVGADTVWDLASLTKPLATAGSILMLAGEGAFHLDEDLARFLPGDSPSLRGITLRHCLTHTSGLRPWEKLHSQNWSRSEIVHKVRSAERQRPAGQGYAYSDLGYILLGEVVESVSGHSVAAFAAERIFGLLGMLHTTYLPPAEWAGRVAATRCPDRKRVLVGEVHDGNCWAMGGVAGHAGLFGSLGDLETYARMILNGGEVGGTRILAPLLVRQMGRNQNPAGISGHTLGWFTRPNGYFPGGDFLPQEAFGHTGFTGTSLVLAPSLGIGVVLLTNRVYMETDAAPFLRFRRRWHNAAAACLSTPADDPRAAGAACGAV